MAATLQMQVRLSPPARSPPGWPAPRTHVNNTNLNAPRNTSSTKPTSKESTGKRRPQTPMQMGDWRLQGKSLWASKAAAESHLRGSSPDDAHDGDAPQKAPRKRASKPKVRTGCISCKLRHVKCDERKPACLK
jgi:hypothetical protein